MRKAKLRKYRLETGWTEPESGKLIEGFAEFSTRVITLERMLRSLRVIAQSLNGNPRNGATLVALYHIKEAMVPGIRETKQICTFDERGNPVRVRGTRAKKAAVK